MCVCLASASAGAAHAGGTYVRRYSGRQPHHPPPGIPRAASGLEQQGASPGHPVCSGGGQRERSRKVLRGMLPVSLGRWGGLHRCTVTRATGVVLAFAWLRSRTRGPVHVWLYRTGTHCFVNDPPSVSHNLSYSITSGPTARRLPGSAGRLSHVCTACVPFPRCAMSP